MIPPKTLRSDLLALATLNRCGHAAAAIFPAAHARLRHLLEARMTLLDRILPIIARSTGADQTTLDGSTPLAEIADSFGLVEIVLDLEDALQIDLPDGELDGLTTIDDLAALCQRRILALSGAPK